MSGHVFRTRTIWTGNRGEGTASYRSYDRDYLVQIEGKPDLAGSSDPAFRGDAGRHNPEDLFVAALSGCHMLWYLHLSSVNGIRVIDYVDDASGSMSLDKDGGGRFDSITLRPRVTIGSGGDPDLARRLHSEAHSKCFIANSISCALTHEPEILVAED